MKRILLAIAVLGATTTAGAAGLSKKYKNWDRTPEAYFLTHGERAQWKKIQTDADAQNFILDYKAKRGPEWEKMLAERIAATDKYFSAGETKGSETLRGKVVIMFGPPSGTDTGAGRTKDSPVADANTSFVVHPELALSSGGANPTDYGAPHAQTSTYMLIYDDASAPKAIGAGFKVELKMISNAHQETWDPADLDAKFEAVAEASISKKDGDAPPR